MISKIYSICYQLMTRCYYKLVFRSRLNLGKNFRFRKSLHINIRENGKVTVGDECFFNHDCSINCRNVIKIGNDCRFGENVKIYDHNHKFRNSSLPINEQGFTYGEVVIGNNCWIGSNVVILRGTKLGNHCVVSAGCVISGEIPDDSIVRMPNFTVEKMKI